MRINHLRNSLSLEPFICSIKIVLLPLMGFALGCGILSSAGASEPDQVGEQAPMDPEVARIWELLSADRLTILNEEILATASDDNVSIEVILAKQELRLLVGKGAAMICPIASGNPVSRTPKGQFKITAVTANEQIPHRGVFLAATGNILVKDVDRGRDPMPAGASFRPQPVALVIHISGGTTSIQAGLATRTGTTSGDIRIPVTAAQTLSRLVKEGTPVMIK